MIRMAMRSSEQGVAHHEANPVRVYLNDGVQRDRILRSVDCAEQAMAVILKEGPPIIVEIGCGAADICGTLSEKFPMCEVIGYDCHEQSLVEAVVRYPRLHAFHDAIAKVEATMWEKQRFGLCILCEVLEHLPDPVHTAKFWLSRSSASMISHPLDEAQDSQMSGGDHAWSLSEEDHKAFFAAGGHVIDHTEMFRMGAYDLILSRGHRERT